MLLELQNKIVYGPIHSRRLGRSLGINILPPSQKMCSFNCLYCQYGFGNKINSKNKEPVFPDQKRVLLAVEKTLKNLTPPPAYLTFSGNGEPTLHPEFPEIVDGIITLKKRWCPESSTAILSNSSTTTRPKIKSALEKLDYRIMKLDAGEPNTFRTFNQPENEIKLETIVAGLSQLKEVTIQTLLAAGPQGNFHKKNVSAWIEKLKIISPITVQLYSLTRSSPCPDVVNLNREDFDIIKNKLNQENIQAEIF
jgi:wyosine [tRNA(Phe)-imidazoG37] synthetase (radical SAM superfamily)